MQRPFDTILLLPIVSKDLTDLKSKGFSLQEQNGICSGKPDRQQIGSVTTVYVCVYGIGGGTCGV